MRLICNIFDPTSAMTCMLESMPWASMLGTIVSAIGAALVALLVAVAKAAWFNTFMAAAADGNLDTLCGTGLPNCGTQDIAAKLMPYAMLLGLIAWTYSILRDFYDHDEQVTLYQVLGHIESGLVMLLGVTLAYSAVMFGYEAARAAGHAMFDEVGGYGNFPIFTNQSGQIIPPASVLVGLLLAFIEWLFIAVLMIASSVGALVAATFGQFALAVTPINGLRGWAGRWVSVVSSLLLMRLFLPPFSAVLTQLLYNMNRSDHTLVFNLLSPISPLVFGIVLLWVTGKGVALLSEGVISAASTVTGLVNTGSAGVAAATQAGNAGSAPARYAYRGTARALNLLLKRS
jgi:hypothetical protein